MKLHRRYLALWRRIQAEDDENVLLRHLLNNTWAVHISQYGYGNVSVELQDGKRFHGRDIRVADIRKIYRSVLQYMRKKGWRP